MVKSLRFLATLAVALVATATSFAEGLADNFKSSYSGPLSVSLNGKALPTTNETILIAKAGDNSINFAMKNFILQDDDPMPVGNVEITDIQLKEENGKIIIQKTQDVNITPGDLEGYPESAWMGPMLGALYPDGISVNIDGYLQGETMELVISIPLPGMDVKVNFSSTPANAINANAINAKAISTFSDKGVKTNGMKKGLNIVKMSDGTTKKVLK